jgi:hypothetical protein
MTWRIEPTDEGEDLVYDGMEAGIAPSPHKGTANIQNANISTEQGEVLASFGRTAQQQAAISNGTLTPDGATLFDAPANLKAGQWISVSASTVTSISTTTSPSTASIEYLIVGGGAGGGPGFQSGAGGGGGAGEYIASTTTLAVGSFAVAVGYAGTGGTGLSKGISGGSSSIATIDTAVGGGGGGLGVDNVSPSSALDGNGGASGGGGGGGNTGYQGTGGTGSAGNNGGAGHANATTNNRAGGGGGGSGGAGQAGASAVGGAGGAGTTNSISGSAVFYAAGGGGGSVGTKGEGGSNNAGGDGGDNGAGVDATTPGSAGGGGSSNSADNGGGDGAAGIVIISYTTNSIVASGGVVSQVGGKTIHTFTTDGVFQVLSINKTNLYYVSYAVGGKIKLSAKYDPYEENELTHGTTGSITFSTVTTPGAALAKATERFGTATSNEYRYYVLDNNGYVWVYDTNVFDTNGTTWMLPDPNSYSILSFTGMNILNGWLLCLNNDRMYGKPTCDLGSTFLNASNIFFVNPFPTHINYAYVGNQGKLYYTDLNYIGELFPTTSLLTTLANVQSYCSYTASTTTGTVSSVINGSIPFTYTATGATARIPAVFFTDVYGTAPTNLSGGIVYWIEYDLDAETFEVYAASTGGSAIDMATGATGKQYFNTFGIFGNAGVSGSSSTVQFTQQRVNLPAYEVAQCLVEVGNVVIIGGKSNVLYPWNQIDAIPSDFIELPENDVKTMINVNNMAYIFAGNKANIYISNGSVASLALKIPDYCAGVPGTPNSYIEPYFTWFDSMFLRGRVYCSVLDQTATKAGNTGGVWSFIPSGNMSSTDTGLSLRLENQNSYGDYDGCARILIPNEEQNAISPQYWSWWQDSYTTGLSTFGIDTTASTPVTTFVIETDLIPTGTLLSQDTFTQLEYKLSTNAISGDTVQLYYRLNSTAAWTSCGTAEIESSAPLSGYYNMAFQKTQWLQFRAVCSTPGTTASSFTRLAQIRLR